MTGEITGIQSRDSREGAPCRKASPRILMVTERYLPLCGGTERQLQLLARSLAAREIPVEVVTPRTFPQYPTRETMDGIPIHRLRYPRIRKLATLGTLIHLAWFLLLRGRRFDVIHIHTVSYLALAATLIGKILRKRVLLKVVGWWEIDRGVLNPGRRRRWGTRLSLALLRKADTWIAISRAVEQAILAAGIPAERIRFVPNGVDTDRFSPGDRLHSRNLLGMDPDRPRVVYVGRLVPVKALPCLLRAWRNVIEKVPGAYLDIVGNGPLLTDLEEQSRKLEIQESVVFHREKEDVVPYLQAANCFVLPSTMEGLSNTLLEAMAVSLPIVATRISGSEDLIEDQVSGLLVNPGDENDLANRMLELLSDPERAEKMGMRARQLVEACCGIRQVTERYSQLYLNGRMK